MTNATGPLMFMDPRDEDAPKPAVLARRPSSLDGKVIGLLSNQKPHSEELLRMIADVINERYSIKGIVEHSKPSHQWPAGPDALKELAARCDVMIHATAE